MSDETAPVGGADAIVSVPAVNPANNSENFTLEPREAARQLANYRWKRDNPEKPEDNKIKPAEPSAPVAATEPEELAEEPTDAQSETIDPVETTAEAEPEALPPIEPPRSWTKDEKEEFATYPRDAQEKIARREQDREATLRRSQNEAAEERRGIQAERAKAEQVRQQYESALPLLLQTLQETQQGEFSDIKTMADVTKLANEDWPRYAKWDAAQKQIAAVSQEVRAAQDRQQSEFKKSWADYASKQDQLLNDKAPELADKSKAEKTAKAAQDVLKDVGFSVEELAQAWNGEASLSLRDHRMQLLILDAVKYREAKSNVKPAPKPVPSVQRPGVSRAPTSADDAQIQALQKRFDRTGDPRDGAALLTARRRASA